MGARRKRMIKKRARERGERERGRKIEDRLNRRIRRVKYPREIISFYEIR